MAGRILVNPVSMNAAPLTAGGVLPQAAPGTYGVDAAGAGGTAFGTVWGTNNGIMFPNNGQCWVYIYNGPVNAGGPMQILLGRKVEGSLPPPGTYGWTLAISSTYYVPPLSASDFNQQDAAAYGGGTAPGGATAALGGAIGAAGVGYTCIDFTTVTQLAVRVYQVSQIP